MELDRLIEGLSVGTAYPEPAATVDVCQTHISAVFLAGAYAYKIKKPVDLGFLDFTTLEKRKHDCLEELRLNRRLAADVYLDVVPITATADGRLQVEGDGPVVEWAVKMQRLPDEATLEHRLQQGQNVEKWVELLAVRIATFHAGAERGAHISEFGRYDVVQRNALENFDQAAAQRGTSISHCVFDRLQSLTVESLDRQRPILESRAAGGVPCDTHGDLRPGHVYIFPDRSPPADLVIVDCIEFNERFRFADPVSDMAFLTMGLARAGHAPLGALFADAYFRASGDEQGRALLPLYVSYRAAVRGKVDGMQAVRQEIAEHDRQLALAKARGSWLLALGTLESPNRKPCLLLVAGLPGTGKSTLAADLAGPAHFDVIRSDVVRKELAGVATTTARADDYEQGLYTPEWTERTYAECLRRAQRLLFEGRRVAIDASFRDEAHRQRILKAAIDWGVPAVMLVCGAEAGVIRNRLAGRAGDVSDADWSVHRQAAERWEPPGALARRAMSAIDTGGPREQSLSAALDVLRQRGLYE